ncbi:PDDEXK-like family protein [Myroides sp. LJL116]
MNILQSIQTINSLISKYKEISNVNGENYNVFKIIGLTTNEQRVHSAFLANLLDPKGSHGYGTVFLKLFIEQLGITGFNVQGAVLKVERNIGKKTANEGGFLDICIWDNNDFHIIIENKIYASDQENQMIRYFNYGNRRKHFCLFYLTLNGSEPNVSYSCTDPITGKELAVGQDYSLLSYSFDIKTWLEKCREKAVTSPLLREGISHYLHLINYLTNQNMSSLMKTEVTKELVKRESVLNLAMLKQSIQDAELSIQLDFWNKLITKFTQEGYEVLVGDLQAAVARYYSTSRDNKYYGIEILLKEKENYQIRYGIRIDDLIYNGFTIWEVDNNAVNHKPEYSPYINIIETINSEYAQNDYWLGWKWANPLLNFKNINEDTCTLLANMDETIDTLFESFSHDIKAFLERL